MASGGALLYRLNQIVTSALLDEAECVHLILGLLTRPLRLAVVREEFARADLPCLPQRSGTTELFQQVTNC